MSIFHIRLWTGAIVAIACEPDLSQNKQVSQGGEPTEDKDAQLGLLGYDWLKFGTIFS